MDSLVFRCPGCQQPFQVLAQQVGQVVRCPGCEETVQIPAAPTASSPQSQGASPQESSPQPSATDVPLDLGNQTKVEEVQAYGCPKCEKPFGIYPSMFGSEMACPHCRETILVQPKANSSGDKTGEYLDNVASSAAKTKRKRRTKTKSQPPAKSAKSAESTVARSNQAAQSTPKRELENIVLSDGVTVEAFVPQSVDHLLPPKFSAVDPAFFYRRHQDGSQVLLPGEDGSLKVVDNRIVKIKHNGQTYELISSPRYERIQRMVVTNVLAVIVCGLLIAIAMTLLNG